MKVLLVEDDKDIAETVCDALTTNGYQPRWCQRGSEALACHSTADVALLDVNLSDIDGLVLAAHTDESSMVAALRRGADNYVTKPPRLRELLARVEALARGVVMERTALGRVVQVDDVAGDTGARKVRVGEPVKLTTAKEFDVLDVLAHHAGNAVSRQQITEECLGEGRSRTIAITERAHHDAARQARLSRGAAHRPRLRLPAGLEISGRG